jgi:cell division protein FtsI/penicillin-binding protein 2
VREEGQDWRATIRQRTATAAVVLAVWAVGIEARLVFLQVVDRAELQGRAERQHKRTIAAPAKRGDILDRKGHVLATSADADSIYAVPSEIGDETPAAARLCGALGDCTPREREALARALSKRRAFAWVRRQVSPDEARRVALLNLDGVGFIKESRRFYPNKELAAHVLGYVGIDNNGLNGIEFAYDSQIRGKNGTVLVQTDARRHVFSRFERPPTSGSSIELTIDEYLQHVTERELRAGVLENRAAAGTAIVMDPRSGEILAMANEPTFNPNVYRDFSDDKRRNRAVQDLYEPGSTFKLVTASAAIEERVMPVDASIDTSPGVIRIGSRVVRDTANHGVLSFGDVIADSSNVGAIKIGFRVGTCSAMGLAVRSRRTFPARIQASSGTRRSGPKARSRPFRSDIRLASRHCRWRARSAPSPIMESTSSRGSCVPYIATTADTWSVQKSSDERLRRTPLPP